MSSSNVTYSIFTNHDKTTTQVCFNETTTHSACLWMQNSLEETLPTFVLQLALILSLNRILLFLSEFCNVPRIVPNIFAGFLLGPSVLGKWKYFFKSVFPYNSLMTLETVGALTLVYYVFLVGLEVDLKAIRKCYFNKKAMIVACTGIVFTLPIGMWLYYLLVTDMGHKTLSPNETDKHMRGALFWGMTLSCSSEFPEIVKILSDLKLLLTDNGQLAITSILINDLLSWTLFMLVLTQLVYVSLESVLILVVLVLVCSYVVYPFTKWIVKKVSNGDREFRESQVLFLLNVVLVIGLIADGLGSHSITGAFFLGVFIPKGALNNAVQDKVYDFVAAFMMPLFFLMLGERTTIQDLALNTHWITVVTVIVLALLVKMVFVFAVSRIYRMPLMEGLSLALLMNTKGTTPLIILYSAMDRLELKSQTFVVMLLACWLMTAIAGPVLYIITKTATSKGIGSKRRNLQDTRPDSPLRVLACIHSKHDANAIIGLLKASSPSVRSPIQVLAVELIEMTDRPTSSLLIRDARRPSFKAHPVRVESLQKNNGDKLGSFDNLSQAIFADKLRIISDYNTMHKDIINLCVRRNVNLIVTTLHRQPTYDGLGAGTATARALNIINRDHDSKDEKRLVLENLEKGAPCSLAIFVDRDFGGEKNSKEMRIAMFYIGGVDDREALSYAWRMSRNMEVQLTVVRLVWDSPDDEFDELDREYLRVFVYQTNDTPTIRYLEKVVKDEKETVRLLNRVGSKGFDLYIIGRGHGRKMSLAQTLDPVLDEPVFGPLGDTLTDLNSAAKTSILIFQKEAESDDSVKPEFNASTISSQFYDGVMDRQQQVYTPAVTFGPNFRGMMKI